VSETGNDSIFAPGHSFNGFSIIVCRRELHALQAENYALEKQVHSYQQSLSRGSSNGGGAISS